MDFAAAYDPVRALQSAGRVAARAPLPILAGGSILALSNAVLGLLWFLHFATHHDHGAVVLTCCALACVAPGAFFVSSWIRIGFTHAVHETLARGEPRAETVFDARNRFADMVLAEILAGAVVVLAFVPVAALAIGAHVAVRELHNTRHVVEPLALLALVVYVPVVAYALLGLSFYRPALLLENLRPSAAIQRSWRLARGRRLRLLLYWIVLTLFALLGLVLCCVGVLPTSTLASTATVESFVAWTRSSVDSDRA